MKLPDLLTHVEQIARAAGIAILEIYQRAHVEVQRKDDNSPLTAADMASEAVIKTGLEKLDDQYLIISEERTEVPYADRAKAHRLWMVDPLDGTKEFLKRNDEFCVCIALLENDQPILGVIHAPVTGISYAAIKGGGAQVISTDGKIKQLPRRRAPEKLTKPKTQNPEAKGLRFGVSRSHLNEETTAYLSTFEAPIQVPMGSALKFCAIADDAMDVYPRFGPTMEWDTAAGDVLIHEIGGALVDARTGKPLVYNKQNLLNPPFIAKGWVS